MANRERARDRGARRANELLATLGREARAARTASGLTQAEVARAVGLERSWISRFERMEAPGISFTYVCTILAVVGLDLSARAYPGGDPIRDSPQTRLVGRLHVEIPPEVPFQTEAAFPNPGDPRAWDVLMHLARERWGVEAETHLADVQARMRSLQLKRRDGGVDGVILLLADTRHHRALLREHPHLFAWLKVRGPEALAALRNGLPPPGDALILL